MTLEQALMLTAELLGTPLSVGAARLMLADLAAYPEATVLAALTRCRREVTGRLTLAAIVERLDDGRPGPEAAWAGCPRDEGETVVWTDETRDAFGVAGPLLAAGDRVGARMAFLEAYRRGVAEARAAHTPVAWSVSLGHAVAAREGPITAAVTDGRLEAGAVAGLLPGGAVPDRLALPRGEPVRLRDVLGPSAPAEARAALEADLARIDREETARRAADRQARVDREAARKAELARQVETPGDETPGETDEP